MNRTYDDLVRYSTKGDKEALRELFALGEQFREESRFEDATKAFRDAGISYRIAAFRNLARAEDAESRAAWSGKVLRIYQKWIEQNPKGMRELPLPIANADFEGIRRVVFDSLSREEEFIEVFVFLENALSSLGMEFYSPGGSPLRRICNLLREAFGLDGAGQSQYLRHTEVRVGIHLVASEIVRRCGHSA